MKLSAPAQTTAIKWFFVTLIVVMVLIFIGVMWDKIVENQYVAIALILGLLVIVLGGTLMFGGIKINK